MAIQRSFGRRVSAQPPRVQAGIKAATQNVAVDEIPAERLPLAETDDLMVDRELAEWKRARKQHRRIPWRQLSLMASLCFGIASFVLPDSVNASVQWLLYALMAASLYAGFSRRREASREK
jgi:hypothetical protein